MAWDPSLTAEAIAREWAAQTFSPDPKVVDPIVRMMLGSREAVVNYTGALGLAHQMATGHHYGPGPWIADLDRPEWNPAYYHRAKADGIGFERTADREQCDQPVRPPARRAARRSAHDARIRTALVPPTCPGPTPHRAVGAAVGRVWSRATAKGSPYVAGMRREWDSLRPVIDAERWQKTADFLAIEERDARWWRDASLAYWMSVNGLPLPAGEAPPAHDLAWYKAQAFPFAPGDP
jgi:alpha-glucuronidase